ncbi:MAG: toxic anion resistance protein [Fibrobacterales bacterium]
MTTDANELVPQSNEKIQQEVDALIERIQKGEEKAVQENIDNLGMEEQQESSRKMELLKGRVGTLLKEVDGDSAAIPKGLMDLRNKLDELNPHKLGQPGFFGRLLGKTPVVGKALKQIAVKYETVQHQIDVIVGGLRNGQEQLERDNIDLTQIYDQLEVQQGRIKEKAALGELFVEKTESYLTEITEPSQKGLLQNLLNAAAIRTQDLRTIEQVNLQFFTSIDMTVANNKMLAQSITRTLTVTTNLLTVGLSIQAALVQQKKALEATKATQEYASDLLAANAASIKQNTREIGALYQDPVLNLDKVKQAYDDLVTSMDELDQIKSEGITKAKEGIKTLNTLSSDLSVRQKALHNTTTSPQLSNDSNE